MQTLLYERCMISPRKYLGLRVLKAVKNSLTYSLNFCTRKKQLCRKLGVKSSYMINLPIETHQDLY